MGADPVTTGLLLGGSLGGPILSALFAPEGQEIQSFEGKGTLDPVAMMTTVQRLMENLGAGIAERAASPISLPSSYVQTPTAFTGGGLPFPIGVSAEDPALANPSLMGLQGMGQFQDLFSDAGLGRYTGPGGDESPPPPDPFPMLATGPVRRGASSSAIGAPTSSTQPGSVRRRPVSETGAQLVRATDLMTPDLGMKQFLTDAEGVLGGDDMDQAAGGVTLLLEALQGLRPMQDAQAAF
jgi:hypothetical protein